MNERLIDKENNKIVLSLQMAQAILSCVQENPETTKVVGVTDVLMNLLTTDGCVQKIVAAVAFGNREFSEQFSQVSQQEERDFCVNILIEGIKVPCNENLLKALNYAKEISPEAVTPRDFLLAEIGINNSKLLEAFTKTGADLSVKRKLEIIAGNYQQSTEIQSLEAIKQDDSMSPVISEEPRNTIDFAPKSRIADLITEAREGKFSDIFLRPKWVSQLLSDMERNTVCVLACEEEISENIIFGLANELGKDDGKVFKYSKIIMADPVALEENPAEAIGNAITAAKNGVLYLPELHRYLQPKDQASAQAGKLIKKAIASREIKIVTNVSEKQWRELPADEYLQKAKVIFPEPTSINETISLICAQVKNLEKKFSTDQLVIKITPKAIETAAKLADRFCRQLSPPLGAINLLYRAATETRIRASEMIELHDSRVALDNSIDEKDIYIALEKYNGIKAKPEDPTKYLEMEKALSQRVVGQDEAIAELARCVRRSMSGLKDPKRPIGNFVFLGPTGVGKTELAKALAEFLFDDENAIVQLNMSEYSQEYDVSRLLGAAPGLVGYKEGGRLTDPVDKQPYSVVLFDECEKAHPKIFNILLQLMEEGVVQNSEGKIIKFNQTVVILTGNVGAEYFSQEGVLGREGVVEEVINEAKATFRPELINRLDSMVVFNSLKKEHLFLIVDINLRKLNKMLAEQEMKLKLTEKAKQLLVEKGYSPEYGARPLRRVMEKLLNDGLSVDLLKSKYSAGDVIIADAEGDVIIFSKETSQS